MRLLIVEDEVRIAAFLVKGLTACGYSVDHVETGLDALRRLDVDPRYDLLVLDLGLPDVDGLEVLRILREGGSKLRVIVLTARSADRDEGLRLGADDFLVKPLPFRDLLERVRALPLA
jgi:DNA-binding response OmpR family regulator